VLVHHGHDLLAGVVQRLELEAPILPGGDPFPQEAFGAVDALVHLLLGPAGELRHVPHEVGRGEVCRELPGALKRLIGAAYELDVGLRHT